MSKEKEYKINSLIDSDRVRPSPANTGNLAIAVDRENMLYAYTHSPSGVALVAVCDTEAETAG